MESGTDHIGKRSGRLLRALRFAVAGGLVLLSLAAGASPGPDELEAARARRDYFRLRELLGDPVPGEGGERGYYRAILHHAFNRPEESNAAIAGLLAGSTLDPARRGELERLRMSNHLRLHDYPGALAAARRVASAPRGAHDPEDVADAANTARMLAALADVPPQRVEVRGPSRLALGATRRVPVTLGGATHRFPLDTGANLSVLMRSVAEGLGLEIRPAGVEVVTSTGGRVPADVAVAPRLEIGRLRFENVAFLVFPDELLTFPGGHTIPGLIGHPVIEAMGEVRFRRDDVLEIPARPPRRTLGNLALHENEPLVQVSYGRDRLVCRFDTGAGETAFYAAFYRRFRERIDAMGRPETSRTGGVGGVVELPVVRLPRVVFTLAAAGITLEGVDVYTDPLAGTEHLDCNIGLDALRRFRFYGINYRDMALVVEE